MSIVTFILGVHLCFCDGAFENKRTWDGQVGPVLIGTTK